MRGSLKQRTPGTWTIRVDNGFGPSKKDPTKLIRKQHVETLRGTKQKAEKRLSAILSSLDAGTLVEPSKLTVGAWLEQWLALNKPRFRPSTHTRYKGIIENDLSKAPIANVPLQKLRASTIEQYYAGATEKLSGATLALHHTILHSALRKAKKDKLIPENPAADLDGKPRRKRDKGDDARQHCWSAAEARTFLAAAGAAGPQPAAFYALALDTGMRKGELCGLVWEHVDLDAAKIRVVQQLLSPTLSEDATPVFGPTKTGKPRTITVSAETVELLRVHRRHQRELMMANRTTYAEHGLVFAKEWSDMRKRGECLGQPLQMNNLGQREYARLIKAAEVKAIKFHGLRHTCATLLLQAGEPVHVVSQRLGHTKVSMTMEVYAHVLPDMGAKAAATMGALLHG
jgi:integrase